MVGTRRNLILSRRTSRLADGAAESYKAGKCLEPQCARYLSA